MSRKKIRPPSAARPAARPKVIPGPETVAGGSTEVTDANEAGAAPVPVGPAETLATTDTGVPGLDTGVPGLDPGRRPGSAAGDGSVAGDGSTTAAGTSATSPTSPDSGDEPGDDEPQEFVVPHWDHSLMTVEPEPVYEADLKALLKSWRRGRATKRISQVLQDGYVAIFSVVLIVAMLGSAVVRAQGDAAQCDSATCQAGRTLLPWVVLFAAFSLTLAVARIFGPVVASSAEGFWLMDAPIRRRRLLSARLVAVLAAVAAGAALIGGILAALTGYPLPQIGQWAAALGLGAAGLTAFAALEQTFARTWLTRTIQWVCGVAAFAALVIITGQSAGWFGLSLQSGLWTKVVIGVAIGGVALLAILGTWALLRLDYIHRARLVSGGNLVTGMQGAAFALDLGLMRDILVERDAQAIGQVRPMLGGGMRRQALIWREVQRLWRYPKRLILLIISIGVPYAVGALGLETFSPFITALELLIAFVPLLNSLRVVTRTRGLARMLPFSNPQIRLALITPAAFLALIWAVLTTPAFLGLSEGGEWLFSALFRDGFAALPEGSLTLAPLRALLTAIAGLLAGVRWVSAKPADYGTPMMQTGFGAMPPGLMFNLFKGIDIVVVVTGPLLLGWHWGISVAIAVICAWLLSGSFDMQEMQAMQEEMKKEQAKLKAGGGSTGGTKQVISRPSRR